jgi:hypothetical protein
MDGIKIFSTTSSAPNRIRNFVYHPILDEEDRMKINKSTSALQKQIIQQQNDPASLLRTTISVDIPAQSTLDDFWESSDSGPSRDQLFSPGTTAAKGISGLSMISPHNSKIMHRSELLDVDDDDCIIIDDSDIVEVAQPSSSVSRRRQRQQHRQLIPQRVVGRQLIAPRCRKRLVRHNVAGDGNCFFRALSYMLYGTEDRHLEVCQNRVFCCFVVNF